MVKEEVKNASEKIIHSLCYMAVATNNNVTPRQACNIYKEIMSKYFPNISKKDVEGIIDDYMKKY